MSLEFPCVHFEKGWCKLCEEPDYKGPCAMGPCKLMTPSNGDVIRQLSDEELAVLVYKLSDCWCQNLPECKEALDSLNEIPEEKCLACALAWLRKPAEGN